MKKPSLVKIVAVVNSLLVVYMLYTVYDLKQARNAPKAIQPQGNMSRPEPPTIEELLIALEADPSHPEKLQILKQLPNLQKEEANRLHLWLNNKLFRDAAVDRLERLDITDAAYRALIGSDYDESRLSGELQTRVSDDTLWLPERNQALIHLFLLYGEKAPRTTDVPTESTTPESDTPTLINEALASALVSAMNAAKSASNTTLAATCLDGSLYLYNSGLEIPAQSTADEIALTALSESYEPSTQIIAIRYAQTFDLDIVSQAANLLTNSKNVPVAIAAKKYLVDKASTTEPALSANATGPLQ